MIKKLTVITLTILVAIQFIKLERNISDDQTYHVSKKYQVTPDLEPILKSACYDCHSNKTEYPAYANAQPIGFFLEWHIRGGKKHLNFSEFTKKRIAIQNHKFEEIIELVENKKMPLASYTYFGLHKDAKLSDDERKIIVGWAKSAMDSIKVQFPADSLVLKR